MEVILHTTYGLSCQVILGVHFLELMTYLHLIFLIFTIQFTYLYNLIFNFHAFFFLKYLILLMYKLNLLASAETAVPLQELTLAILDWKWS